MRQRARVRFPWVHLAAAMVAAGGMAVVGPACDVGAGRDDGPPSGETGGGGGGGAGGAADAGIDALFDGPISGALEIVPKDPLVALELPLTGQTVSFTALHGADKTPVDAKWSLATPELGSIDDQGVFTPNGKKTGSVEVRAEYLGEVVKSIATIVIHAEENPGNLVDADKTALRAGPGIGDAGWQFVYPYDQTVFPRGVLAPEIHLTPGDAKGSAFYLHVVSNDGTFEYEGFFKNGASFAMEQSMWDALAYTASGTSLVVQVSKLSGGVLYGPIFRTWRIASGKLHGVIYYNTYDSQQAGNNGAIMRIKGGSSKPDVLIGNCTVCHSVSADGSTVAAANHNGQGGTFDISGASPVSEWQTAEEAAFAGLYPDGSLLVTNGLPGTSWPPNTPGSSFMTVSELRTKNGTVIPSSGIELYYAQTPIFSHDGTRLSFCDRSSTPPYTANTLSLLDYDPVAQKFSNYQVLAVPVNGRYLSWPAFTPDGKYVVYQDGDGADLATWQGQKGRIYAVDLASKTVTYLSMLNGDGYMPAGARDEHVNYEPTIAPLASGGYFWVTFTSRRTWGNKLTGPVDATKRLWIAALDINAPPGVDGSHPAFYVQGQELNSGNSRGFWSFDACKPTGATCESGDECCEGYCNPKSPGSDEYVCGPLSGTCAKEYEACKTAADCCETIPPMECINGKCAKIGPG